MIKNLKAGEILDSRGDPTVEVELETESGVFKASVPSGASKGKYEAVELRDGGARCGGRGVLKAVENVNKIIAPKIKGENPAEQEKIDELMIELDGTEKKSKLGANAILPASVTVCRAGAASKKMPLYQHIAELAEARFPTILPRPSVLLIEGRLHAENNLDFQEFMVIPSVDSFKEGFGQTTEIYRTLGSILLEKYGKKATKMGYEGGFSAPLSKTREALDLIAKAIEKTGWQDKIKIALDAAASTFYSKSAYNFEGAALTGEEFLSFYSDLIKQYPIVSLEDPYDQEDWESWQKLASSVKAQMSNVLVIGDDLLTTNIKRIKEAQQKKACDGLILKPNQIGTVTESIAAAKLAKSYGWKIMVSHRAGDTLDDFISDLAVGIGADFIKAGAPTKEERVVKYNRLLEIEEEIKK